MRNSSLVFSTDKGKLCPKCEQPIQDCQCTTNTQHFQGDGIVRIGRETKGRKGKGVTLISGLSGSEAEIKALAKRIKQLCGSGGAVKQGVIEIQGDHREQIKTFLEQQHLKVTLTGG